MLNSNVTNAVSESGNVILLDPNKVNVGANANTNAIPQYQDMYIFAELSAKSRNRTLIINNVVSTTGNGREDGTINFMGMNNDVNKSSDENSDYHRFTTNYYDGSMGTQEVLESFGITSIKVTINSSYVPQVQIQFVDIRGVSFFNEESSPYRILFDFPPPIFKLIIKGYYGKSLSYDLHLVKYTSAFQAENGNFVIDANFIAMTFAPLSDILFRYVVNIPLMSNISSSPSTNTKPKTTNDLITKLKSLYSTVGELINAEKETKTYSKILKKQEIFEDIFRMINTSTKNEKLNDDGLLYLIIKTINYPENFAVLENPSTIPNQDSQYQKINNISQYKDILMKSASSTTSTNSKNRLLIGYIAGSNVAASEPASDQWMPNNPLTSPISYSGDDARISRLELKLNEFANTLTSALPIEEKFSIPRANGNEYNNFCISDSQRTLTRYVVLDITDFFEGLYKKYNLLNSEKINIAGEISVKTNAIVIKELGMLPTIYNIFEIILNDVDTVFREINRRAVDAEIKHNEEYDIIVGEDKSVNSKNNHLYAFPLIINNKTDNSGISRQERIAPIELSKRASFPEMDLVYEFIDTFKQQRTINQQNELRNQQNDDGTFKWIPIAPNDSTLSGGSPKSPYRSLTGDGTAINKDEVYKTLLKRYYILTQGIIPDDYLDNRNSASAAMRTLFANGEALNLSSALAVSLNPDFSESMKDDAAIFKSNPNTFYNAITKITDNGINLYNFGENTVKGFILNPDDNNSIVYTDKGNSEYVGIKLNLGNIDIRDKATDTSKSENPIEQFFYDAEGKWYRTWLEGSPSSFWYDYTKENVFYIRDTKGDVSEKNTVNGCVLTTRYLADKSYVNSPQRLFYVNEDLNFNDALISGNKSLTNDGYGNTKKYLENVTDITEIWSEFLGKFSSKLPEITNPADDIEKLLSAMYILSNFGCTLGPFNVRYNYLNKLVFTIPAVVEVPKFLPLYIGALVHAIEGDNDNNILPWVDKIGVFFNRYEKILTNNGFFIGADIYDIKTYLSISDRKVFKDEFSLFFANDFPKILESFKSMLEFATARVGSDKSYDSLVKSIKASINPKISGGDNAPSGAYFEQLIEPLIERTNMLVRSQITFKIYEPTYKTIDGNGGYISLADRNKDDKFKTLNDEFFRNFFIRLESEIILAKKKIIEEKEKEDKVKGDVDIINQIYYSFKNINDKWLAGQPKSEKGYPYNCNGKRLIDSFVFVDRAMNPIGDTIINAELLLQIFEDPNISVFSALSQILSSNGFEFFPLQNFMSFTRESWEESFKIDTSGENSPSAAFVCMYIGGSSSYPSIAKNGFEDDGISNLLSPDITDFSSGSSNVQEEQEIKNDKFPWKQVRAFSVKFGEQNQSMFTDIKIDSKEYPETNESIQILSRLAGDNKMDAPTPKGQNLYNLYENRSYKATITGLGNAMIQPTQYFQLENVPLFNGAYIILSVEHTITANKMMTSFSGTKILKYPVPRVLSPVAFVGFEDIGKLDTSQFLQATLITNIAETKYNSMYTLKIV